ncbi:MAG: hypothetical protein HC844_01710 [Tabrizicola sp.]|nr:hypothetical protein [Tabrizicola sp.]
MTTAEPLTRYLGKAERTLQSLLQTQLRAAGMTFPEWAVLTFLSGGPLTRQQLTDAVVKGHVAGARDPADLIKAMVDRGLAEASGERLAMTAKGKEIFDPLRDSVMKITAELEFAISEDDLAATKRTLQTISERAARMLAIAEV